jgi:hypothetical protein
MNMIVRSAVLISPHLARVPKSMAPYPSYELGQRTELRSKESASIKLGTFPANLLDKPIGQKKHFLRQSSYRLIAAPPASDGASSAPHAIPPATRLECGSFPLAMFIGDSRHVHRQVAKAFDLRQQRIDAGARVSCFQ